MTNESIQTLIDSNNLTLSCVFVPFSQSRNKDEKNLSLNWKVTLLRNGKEVLTTDYMQGIGHAPSYKKPAKFNNGKIDEYITRQAQKFEAENGTIAIFSAYSETVCRSKHPIPQPDIKDVLYSLVLDSNVLNYPEFEEWASDCGYETDSRKAESIYRDCLKNALKLRGSLGESILAQLSEAFQDY